jgi:hypothetical protein
MEELRLIQVFLSQDTSPGPGIYEVSLRSDKNFICTCPGYVGRSACKHTRFVMDKVKKNKGTYPLEISTRHTEEDVDKATESAEAHRDFVLKFGKIEVC